MTNSDLLDELSNYSVAEQPYVFRQKQLETFAHVEWSLDETMCGKIC